MIILADTREQKSLSWDGIEGIDKVEEVTLAYGDYTALMGKEAKPVPIVFERKSFSDLFGTMASTDGYRRFKAEMERAKADGVKLILIIEGSYSEVYNGFERSQFEGPAMLKKLATLYVKYDLEYIFCESRRVMARRIADVFYSVERNYAK